MKLLDELKKIDERNGITEDHQVSHDDLRTYVDTQVEEMQRIIMRDKVDVLLNEQIKVETEDETLGRDAKRRELEKRISQMTEAVSVLSKLANEL